MIEYIFAFHLLLQLYDIRLGHHLMRAHVILPREGLHVFVELALHPYLVDAINVIVDLMRKQVFNNMNTSNLSH